MPSFDIVSECDMQEIDNALNQARKELASRFDFKDAKGDISLQDKKIIKLSAIDEYKTTALREIVLTKLAKRNVSLKNIEEKPIQNSLGHASCELHIKEGIEHGKAKEINEAIKGLKLKVTAKNQDQQIRVEGKNRDDLQAVMGLLRQKDFGIALLFKNFRD
ncbi:MAG: YajQ family cyclic di-GMP-binding protein [Verrucomicrobiae bacterium]|nr:YajQ family cyclic di-GMP-binding protein [Verrucomicrobiae bacterium]